MQAQRRAASRNRPSSDFDDEGALSPMSDQLVLLGPSEYAIHHRAGFEMLVDAGFDVEGNPFDRPRSRDEMLAFSDRVTAAVVGLDVWDAELIEACPNLRILSKCGVGVDNIDLAAAAEHGVLVTNAPGLNSNGVAELAVGLMLSVLRSIPQSDAAARNGVRQSFGGPELTGKTIGLVGVGNIGALVSRRLRGFDVEVVAFDPYLDEDRAAELGVRVASLPEVLAQADILSLHAPHTPQTERIIDEAALNTMKPGSYLVNTARGPLVDETALHAALSSGHLAGAGLDVFVDEPVDPAHPLLTLPQVVATTHIAAGSSEASVRIGITNAQAIITTLEGGTPENIVNAR